MKLCFVCGSDQRCPHREPKHLRAYPERFAPSVRQKHGVVISRQAAPWPVRRREYLIATGRLIMFPLDTKRDDSIQ